MVGRERDGEIMDCEASMEGREIIKGVYTFLNGGLRCRELLLNFSHIFILLIVLVLVSILVSVLVSSILCFKFNSHHLCCGCLEVYWVEQKYR